MNYEVARKDTINEIAEMISRELGLKSYEAMELFMKSETYIAFEDDTSGLSDETPESTFKLFMSEHRHKNDLI